MQIGYFLYSSDNDESNDSFHYIAEIWPQNFQIQCFGMGGNKTLSFWELPALLRVLGLIKPYSKPRFYTNYLPEEVTLTRRTPLRPHASIYDTYCAKKIVCPSCRAITSCSKPHYITEQVSCIYLQKQTRKLGLTIRIHFQTGFGADSDI